MDLREALDVVLSLAQENALDVKPGYGEELVAEAERQEQAIDRVHQLLSLLSEN